MFTLLRPLLALLVTVALAGACGSNKSPAADGSIAGTLSAQQLPLVTIDGTQYRMAPGARVIGANNLSVTPNQIPAGSAVRYKLDAAGQVQQIRLLSSDK